MVIVIAFLAAGLVPPSNGQRFVERDPIAELVRENPVQPVPDPPRLHPLPLGYVPPRRVTPPMRRFADKVLALKLPLGHWHVKTIAKRKVLARSEMHGDHRGVSIYVKLQRAAK